MEEIDPLDWTWGSDEKLIRVPKIESSLEASPSSSPRSIGSSAPVRHMAIKRFKGGGKERQGNLHILKY